MKKITSFDHHVIHFLRKISIPAARASLFIIFVWFGILKLAGASPAGNLVHALFDQTISFMPFDMFYMLFAWFEILIGVLFIIPKATRLAIPLLILHMVATCLPLALLSGNMWNGFLVPTLEGQYIIKNLAIMAIAISIASHMEPMKR